MYLSSISIDRPSFPRDDCYPFDIPALNATPDLDLRRPVTFLLGENGSGKSTLLEAVAKSCGIHIWVRSKRHIVHKNPFEGRLWEYLRVTWLEHSVPGGFFSAETFRDWGEFLDDVAMLDPGQLRYFGGRTILDQSHGQGILGYFRGRYEIPGIYFLDEPEAALSPTSQLELMRMLHGFAARGHAQFLIATHSPILLALPDAEILELRTEGVIPTPFEETAHFRLYRDILKDPRHYLTSPAPPPVGGLAQSTAGLSSDPTPGTR